LFLSGWKNTSIADLGLSWVFPFCSILRSELVDHANNHFLNARWLELYEITPCSTRYFGKMLSINSADIGFYYWD
jgi:hypothetical protein